MRQKNRDYYNTEKDCW